MTVVSPPQVAETVSAAGAFERLRQEWDDLVRAMERPSPFLVHAWLSEWWRHYGDGWTLAVHVVRQDGRLVGALPLGMVFLGITFTALTRWLEARRA